MPEVCLVLARGFEEIEAVTIIDVLRRAEVDVTTLGVEGLRVEGSHGVTIHADRLLSEVEDREWDMVILPGGLPGAHTLRDHPGVQALIRRQNERSGRIAAICAAPIALGRAGVLAGKQATSYPGFEGELEGATCCEDRVVNDGSVTTSRGPGTALEFSLDLVRTLVDDDTAGRLSEQMLARAG